MQLAVGTCGWQYAHWRGVLYPPGVPQRDWLERYSALFGALEVDTTFYRLPRPETVAGWTRRTPAHMRIALKASRYLTHIRRLNSPEQPVAHMMRVFAPLGPKLAAVLLQLPPGLTVDVPGLQATLRAFPRDVRVALEPRHESWWTDDVRRTLEHHEAAVCLADRDGPLGPQWRTASWGYVRLHGRSGPEGPGYTDDSLRTWVRDLGRLFPADEEVLVFFNNDARGCAVYDALRFREIATSGDTA